MFLRLSMSDPNEKQKEWTCLITSFFFFSNLMGKLNATSHCHFWSCGPLLSTWCGSSMHAPNLKCWPHLHLPHFHNLILIYFSPIMKYFSCSFLKIIATQDYHSLAAMPKLAHFENFKEKLLYISFLFETELRFWVRLDLFHN